MPAQVPHGLDLDAPDHPDKVPAVLRAAAEVYYAAGAELRAAWSNDRAAGMGWNIAARELEACALRIEKQLAGKGVA